MGTTSSSNGGFIHGGIDGFSRSIVFLKCSTNNKAETVKEHFMQAVQEFRLPLRIRTDHGTENVSVAKFMLDKRGVETKPVITGRSVHNQRIERLWVDVGTHVSYKFKDIFELLEMKDDLDPENEIHLLALHHIFLPRINETLDQFKLAWNNHSLRTEKNQTPLQLWTAGFVNSGKLMEQIDLENCVYGIDWDGPVLDIQANNHIEVVGVDPDVNLEKISRLSELFDPLLDDGNCGINAYIQTLQYLLK